MGRGKKIFVAFYDKTHTDVKGALSTSPFVITIAFLNPELAKRHMSPSPLALYPISAMASPKMRKCPGLSQSMINDEHLCLHGVLQGLIDIERKKGFKLNILGRTVNAWP